MCRCAVSRGGGSLRRQLGDDNGSILSTNQGIGLIILAEKKPTQNNLKSLAVFLVPLIGGVGDI